jgi:hypothetical protein
MPHLMKSSGSLRLIRDRDIINNLMEMEKQLQQHRNLLDVEGKEDMMTYPLLASLFDACIDIYTRVYTFINGLFKRSSMLDTNYFIINHIPPVKTPIFCLDNRH